MKTRDLINSLMNIGMGIIFPTECRGKRMDDTFRAIQNHSSFDFAIEWTDIEGEVHFPVIDWKDGRHFLSYDAFDKLINELSVSCK